MRVLIDTNVLISAALSANGTPFQAYIKAASYPNHGLICEQNVDEMKRIFNKTSKSAYIFGQIYFCSSVDIRISPYPNRWKCFGNADSGCQ